MSTAVQLAECDVAMALEAKICLGCGGTKSAQAAVCDSCFLVLPLYLREWVSSLLQPLDGPSLDIFRRAVQHLVDVRALRHRQWPYRSQEELEMAGFRFLDRSQCQSVRCLRPIVWLRTPQGGRMPVDPVTYEPHAVVCFDPVGVALRRIRRLQTPARRRRPARKGA